MVISGGLSNYCGAQFQSSTEICQMSLILVHLSDIHFGQERANKLVEVHKDARERLLDDVRKFGADIAPKRISGVLVTGDIAYGGKPNEYEDAGQWLDRLTQIIGCSRSDVQVVPGNHDIDWDEISASVAYLLKEIEIHGEDKLDEFLNTTNDREILYRRFNSYERFADAYNCPLDKGGGGAGDRVVELAPGRRLRFTGLNSALTCAKVDTQGKLVLGERQRVLQRNSGEELVVLSHHPMSWMIDGEDANGYIRARARVLVTGHEHKPSARVEHVLDDADLLTIEAGATTPPGSDDEFTYAYNLLEFAWEEKEDALAVTVHSRCWSETRKEFVEDVARAESETGYYVLASPRYKEAPQVQVKQTATASETNEPPVIQQESSNGENGSDLMPAEYPDIILRFFKDLVPSERLRLLVEVGAVPENWNDKLSHGIEKALIDRAVQSGRAADIRAKLDELIAEKNKEG
nr:metallophosphoesterase [Sphingorhabdus profundilacus]